MPNHVTNIVSFTNIDDKRIKEILEAIKEEEMGIGSFDFNKIIPMPESLNIESGYTSNKGLEMYRLALNLGVPAETDLSTEQNELVVQKLNAISKKYTDDLARHPDLMKIGKQCYENIQNYGAPTWYEWSVNNWGTKWNAYGFIDKEDLRTDRLEFSTAWSAPSPVIEKFSEMFPNVKIEHQWADEDMGTNVGRAVYLSGEVIEIDIPNSHSKEAYEMAAEIQGVDLEDYNLYLSEDGSNYEYREECEEEMQGGDLSL